MRGGRDDRCGDVERRIAADEAGTTDRDSDALRIDAPVPVSALPGFADGEASVQDGSAQLVADALAPATGARVLDACAAPGGKTAHLLERADVDLVALDIDPARIARIRDNLARLRLADRRVRLVEGDAGTPSEWFDGRPFDRILLDVPCTASGVVRRHPDAKWRHRASDVERFAREQGRLLESAWTLLVPGGRLLYATCSVFDAENEARIGDFTRRHPDALRESLTLPEGAAHRGGQLLPSPSAAGHNQDGFYYALLCKR